MTATTEAEALVASLAALHTTAADGVTFADDDTYIDWSSSHVGGARTFEVGDGDDAVQLILTRDDLVRLHAALTLTLLAWPAST